VTGFGSEKIGIFDTDDLEADTITKTLVEVGAGPSGVVLDEPRNQLYVMNRIDGTISIVSNAATPATANESAVVALRYDRTGASSSTTPAAPRRTATRRARAVTSSATSTAWPGTSAIRSARSSRTGTRSRSASPGPSTRSKGP
jgi:DNA-binding beta-propeller fold protein YncE